MKITRNQLFSIIKEEIENQVTDVTTDVDTDAEVPDDVTSPDDIESSEDEVADGEYTIIKGKDGKSIIAHPATYTHIGTHSSVGKGSVFSGSVTKDMIDSFLTNATIPEGGGGISADFKGGGYLLVAPFDVAMQFADATVKAGTKEDYDPVQKKMVPVPIAEVHTSQPISDFATDVTTVLVFPYDPSRSSTEQNEFVNNNTELAELLEAGQLYALATAFPGGLELEEVGGIAFPKVGVPKATAWGGMENPTWAVIIPDSQQQPMLERWSKLAGLIK